MEPPPEFCSTATKTLRLAATGNIHRPEEDGDDRYVRPMIDEPSKQQVVFDPVTGRGFVLAQLPELIGVPGLTYAMIAAGLAIIYLFSYITSAIPSPLVAILVLTGVAYWGGLDLRTVDDLGELPSALPIFALPQVPLTFETLQIIFPYSIALAAVGLLDPC